MLYCCRDRFVSLRTKLFDCEVGNLVAEGMIEQHVAENPGLRQVDEGRRRGDVFALIIGLFGLLGLLIDVQLTRVAPVNVCPEGSRLHLRKVDNVLGVFAPML